MEVDRIAAYRLDAGDAEIRRRWRIGIAAAAQGCAFGAATGCAQAAGGDGAGA
jgi:hypothetical protein